MIPYFIFNSVCSIDMGILITKLPHISRAERDFEVIEIPGRNGALYIDNKCYKTIPYEIECTLLPGADIRRISAWLNGEGKLSTSRETDKEYDAIIRNQINFEQVYRIYNEFVIKLEVQPVAHSIDEKEINITSEADFYIEQSTIEIKPYMKITGSGNITITLNNKSIILKSISEYIELDCELEEAFKEQENCNNKIECEEFPILQLGQNHISWIGTVTSILIKYKEAYI